MRDNRSFAGALIDDGRPLLLFTGLCLVLSGLFALFLSATGQFLPHDVLFLGMTAEQLCAVNECTMRHSLTAQSCSAVIPRNRTSCGRNWPVADRNNANKPDRTRHSPVKRSSGRPSSINAPAKLRLSRMIVFVCKNSRRH